MAALLFGWDAGASRITVGFTPGGADTAPAEPRLLEDSSEGHGLVIAPTGKGKTRCVVTPNLLHWPGPAVVIDVKGELTATTAAYRRDVLGQTVHVIDPWRITDMPSASLNPLDVFEGNDQEAASQAFMLASMFTTGEARVRDPFWTERGETLIASLLGFAAAGGSHSLGWVSDVLTDDDPVFRMASLCDQDGAPDFAKRGLVGILGTADVTRQGIISTAQSLFRPMMSASVQAACGPSTIPLDAVRRGDPMTIYLVVPPAKIASQAPVLKLWLSVLMSVVTDRRVRPRLDTLFMLDEVAQLGRMEQIRTLLTLGRGYGCRAVLIFQSYAQLEDLYPDHQTLCENAAATLTFGHNNLSSSARMSALFGDIAAETLFRMGPDRLAVKLAGRDTVIARRLDYLTDPLFAGRYRPNPMFDLWPVGDAPEAHRN